MEGGIRRAAHADFDPRCVQPASKKPCVRALEAPPPRGAGVIDIAEAARQIPGVLIPEIMYFLDLREGCMFGVAAFHEQALQARKKNPLIAAARDAFAPRRLDNWIEKTQGRLIEQMDLRKKDARHAVCDYLRRDPDALAIIRSESLFVLDTAARSQVIRAALPEPHEERELWAAALGAQGLRDAQWRYLRFHHSGKSVPVSELTARLLRLNPMLLADAPAQTDERVLEAAVNAPGFGGVGLRFVTTRMLSSQKLTRDAWHHAQLGGISLRDFALSAAPYGGHFAADSFSRFVLIHTFAGGRYPTAEEQAVAMDRMLESLSGDSKGVGGAGV
jgi:hypothetical protein